MAIDASAIARVVGVTTTFRPATAGGVTFLPQRIAVIAQGSTGMSYSSAKKQVTSAAQAGSTYGFGTPIHHILRQLLPANGDGVGTIPVTVYPLSDNGSGVEATGGITPSGTQTKQAAYRVIVNNILSNQFVLPASVSVSVACGLMFAAINAVLEMPVKATLTYGTVTTGAITGNGNGTLTALSVVGAPQSGAWTLKLNTVVANGGVWTLTAPDGTVVSNSLTQTPGVGSVTVFSAGGLQFSVTDGSTDFALNDTFTITVPATALVLKSKWKGQSANAIKVSVDGDFYGTTFTVTQPTGGLVNPSVSSALALIGNVWETLVINALDIADTVALDAINTVGEGRWGSTVRKPFVAFTGNTIADEGLATVISAARNTDRINAQLVSPGSLDLPFVVAARQVARIAVVANNNPPCDYGSQSATGLVPGADGVQWDYPTRDAAVKAGSSTVEVRDGIVTVSDVVTFYAPTGEVPPAYRYVCDIVKLQNIIFNISLRFAVPAWDGAPLIPDDQPTVNPAARQPKGALAEVGTMVDALGNQAILSDPAATKKASTAVINGSNAKRLDIKVPVKLSGNTNIINVDLDFGFYFPAAVAA